MDAQLRRDGPPFASRVAERLEVGRTVLDVDTRQKTALLESGGGSAEELHCAGARLDDMAVAVMPGHQVIDDLKQVSILRFPAGR